MRCRTARSHGQGPGQGSRKVRPRNAQAKPGTLHGIGHWESAELERTHHLRETEAEHATALASPVGCRFQHAGFDAGWSMRPLPTSPQRFDAVRLRTSSVSRSRRSTKAAPSSTLSPILIWLHFFCNLNSIGRVACTLFYAIMRRFTRQFDGSVHTERTRFGDLHQTQFRFLASRGAAERKICQ
jgi:hypothetical protein